MPWNRDEIAARATLHLEDGFYVNLGIGIPALVANNLLQSLNVTFQSENGMLGIGPFPFESDVDADLINASKQTVSELKNTSYFDSATSFAMIRGGHVDVAILGAMQISEDGSIASWMIPGKLVKGMGGAMDLVAGVKKVVVVMEHCSKDGVSKIVPSCTLPLTGKKCVNFIITDLCEFSLMEEGRSGQLTLVECAPHVSLAEIDAKTTASYAVCPRLAARMAA